MAERIPVTSETVSTFLKREMTGSTYHLMYGLHLLSQPVFIATMDALLNSELAVEELIRMGGFTDAEAQLVLKQSLGSWVSPAVSIPTTGTDGFRYLTDTLGLSSLILAEVRNTNVRIPSTAVLGARVLLDEYGHANHEEVEAVFRDNILDKALDGKRLEEYLPQTVSDIHNLVIARSNVPRQELLAQLMSVSFSPLIDNGDTTVLEKLIQVGRRRSKVMSAPSLMMWIMSSVRPPDDVRLRMHQEAAERTLKGEFTYDEIISKLEMLETAIPSFVATGYTMNGLDFQLSVTDSAIAYHFDGNEELSERILIVKDAYEAFFSHRDRVRSFISNVLRGCQEYLIGLYPMK